MTDLRHATCEEIAAELRRRAKEYREMMTADSTLATVNSYDPWRPRRLHSLARELEELSD